ncbi:MAG: ACP S-malonyltransferase [Cyanobacteria bacterium P01_H01_bin.121]
MTCAWVFPGQGSQATGMGADLVETAIGQDRFATAEQILGWSVLDCCKTGGDRLSLTRYTQPCLYTVEAILIDLLRDRGQAPDFVAGHSLGEYSALYAAQVFDFETGLSLVKQRAELMANTANGTMAALLGFDRDALETAISQIEGVVLANDNNPGQVVISGTPAAVQQVMETVKSKRAIQLPVSGAFHSPLMAEAAQAFAAILQAIPFTDAICPVLANVDPNPTTEAQTLKMRLNQQMTGSVRWRETTLQLVEQQIQTVVEIGPGNVLTGLMKRTSKALQLHNIATLASLPTP